MWFCFKTPKPLQEEVVVAFGEFKVFNFNTRLRAHPVSYSKSTMVSFNQEENVFPNPNKVVLLPQTYVER